VLFGAIRALRIPLEYRAELFAAGDVGEIERVLTILAAMRAHMRNVTLGQPQDDSIAASVGMTDRSILEMYHLMAIAKYNERYVIPKAHVEQAHELEELGCSLEYGPYEQPPLGEASGRPSPVAVETFQALRQRQTSDVAVSGEDLQGRVNLLNWDGKGTPEGIFPQRQETV
jgi:nitrate reductase / nitrite oxidoreductase, beta subunit